MSRAWWPARRTAAATSSSPRGSRRRKIFVYIRGPGWTARTRMGRHLTVPSFSPVSQGDAREAGEAADSALSAHGSRPPVFDDEGGQGVGLRARTGDAAHRSEVGAQALSRDLDAQVAAPGAVAQPDVGVVGQQRLELLLTAPELRRDRRADELRGDHRRARVVEVWLEIGHPEGVHVATEHDRVGGLPLAEVVEQAAACRWVAVPSIGPELLSRTGLPIELSHQSLLGDDVPARRRAVEPRREPALLHVAEHGEARIEPFLAVFDGVGATTAGRGARLG